MARVPVKLTELKLWVPPAIGIATTTGVQNRGCCVTSMFLVSGDDNIFLGLYLQKWNTTVEQSRLLKVD